MHFVCGNQRDQEIAARALFPVRDRQQRGQAIAGMTGPARADVNVVVVLVAYRDAVGKGGELRSRLDSPAEYRRLTVAAQRLHGVENHARGLVVEPAVGAGERVEHYTLGVVDNVVLQRVEPEIGDILADAFYQGSHTRFSDLS